jgi:hypothetical protein
MENAWHAAKGSRGFSHFIGDQPHADASMLR